MPGVTVSAAHRAFCFFPGFLRGLRPSVVYLKVGRLLPYWSGETRISAMKPTLHQRVLAAIRRHRMLRAGETVGVAVSGGGDSVALLRLLDELREVLGIRLLVLHFHHQLRGPDADADEKFAAQLAGARGLEFLSGRKNVAAQAQQHGWNLEDAARRLRYEFFSQVVDSGRAGRIAVAHTADDQAETLLAHLVRGTGPTGLAAIYPVARNVVRPLLDIRRQELRAYLLAAGQAWREDQTNLDTSRLRARIRHRLVPLLEREFPPGIVERLGQLAALAREDETFWAMLVAKRYQTLVQATPAGLSIHIPDLLDPLALGATTPAVENDANPSTALTKRLVRRILEELKGDRRQLTARHVEQVLHLAMACSSGHRVHLPAGVVVERSFDRLVFSLGAGVAARMEPNETGCARQPFQYLVEIGSQGSATISIPEIGRRFHLKVIDWPPAASDTRVQAEALDRDLLRLPLVLRNWRQGDSYRPRGRRRAHKLKRLLLESRVALRERTGWPVLTSAGVLAWVRGLPAAQEFAAQEGTKAGLVVLEELL